MDKNQIIGIVLMVLLYIGYIWYTTPTEEDRLAAIAAQEQQNRTGPPRQHCRGGGSGISSPTARATHGIGHHQHRGARCLARSTVWRIGSAALGEDQTYTLASEGVTATFSSRGGLLSGAELTGYKRYQSEELVRLWKEENSAMTVAFEFNEVAGELNLNDFHFEAEASARTASRW